jgi:hypothetical protein
VKPVEAATAVLKVKAQIGPCYTDYPAMPAALAAIGLTATILITQARQLSGRARLSN